MFQRIKQSSIYAYWYGLQKKSHELSGFTFIELIIVVTIIAILSTSAWLALSGETDKARDAKRLQDLAQIQQALETYYLRNSFYPQPAIREDGKELIVKGVNDGVAEKSFLSNLYASILGESVYAQDNVQLNAWGYRPNTEALASCTVEFDIDTNAVVFENTVCGGDIIDLDGEVIGWKGTISEKAGKNSVAVAKDRTLQVIKPFGAEYIQNIGKDPKMTSNPALEEVEANFYIYATYRGRLASSDDKNGATQYQLATTLEKEGPDDRETYIIGNYTQKRGKAKDPHSLIGSGENVLNNGQRIGEDNPKVTRKSDKEKETEIASVITDFNDEIAFLKDNTEVSEDAQQFLDEAETGMEEVQAKLDAQQFSAAEDQLDEVRDILKEAIDRYYGDAASAIADQMKETIENDPSEEIKRDALEKIDDIGEVHKETERFVRNSDDFEDLREEFEVRKQVISKLDILLSDVEDLAEILGETIGGLEDLIPEEIEESLFNSRDDEFGVLLGQSEFTSDIRPEDRPLGTTGGTDTGDTGDTFTIISAEEKTEKVTSEIQEFKDAVEDIKEDLLKVDKEKKKFSVDFNKIILDVDNLEKNIKDTKKEIEESAGAVMTSNAFDNWYKDFTAQQSPFRRLEFALILQSQLSGQQVEKIQIVFNDRLLGEKAGQPGVVRDTGPLSDYSGIPYPLETGA